MEPESMPKGKNQAPFKKKVRLQMFKVFIKKPKTKQPAD